VKGQQGGAVKRKAAPEDATAGADVDGFDFKMNLAVEPFEKAINVAKPRKDKK
jgi:hypothetical protein